MAPYQAGRLLLLLLALTTLGRAGSEDNDSSDNEDTNEKAEEHDVEVVPGKKEGTLWLIVDLEYICVKNDESESGQVFWWECRFRRNQGCMFKICTQATEEGEDGQPKKDGKHTIILMDSLTKHICGQNTVDVLNEKFKHLIKSKLQNAIKASFQEAYNQTRLDFSRSIVDPHLRQHFLDTCITARSFRSAANRARTKMIPVAPKSFHNVDFSLMGGSTNFSQYILAQVIIYFPSPSPDSTAVIPTRFSS
jgi:hypothetical protein